MIIRTILLRLALLIAATPLAYGQDTARQATAAAAAQPENYQLPSFAEPASGVAAFRVGDPGEGNLNAALHYLLKTSDPIKTAAEILKVPEDKIVLVPEIYWNEPKWLDWASKADEQRKSQTNYRPKVGPDDRIPLQIDVVDRGGVETFHGDTVGRWQVDVTLGPSNLAGHNGELTVDIARRLVVKMVRNCDDRTREFFREQRLGVVDRLRARIKDLDKNADVISGEIRKTEGLLLSQLQLSERLADLQRQVLSANLTLDILKARRQATSEELDKLKQQAQAKAADNETLRTLKRIVELRKARFDRLKAMNAQNLASREDADKAEEEMLSAMVDLDRATAAAQKSESQSQLDALAADLSKIAIDRAEAEARLRFLDNACGATEGQLKDRRDADLAASRLQAQLKDKEERRAELQQQLGAAEDALQTSSAYLQLSAGF